jgi:hypothetical protein
MASAIIKVKFQYKHMIITKYKSYIILKGLRVSNLTLIKLGLSLEQAL